MTRFSFSFSLCLWPALASLGACAAPTDDTMFDPEVGSTTAAFSEESCADAKTDQVLTNSTPGSTVSGATPTIYSNPKCWRAYLFDLGDLPSTAAPGDAPYTISVEWADPWPRNQDQCSTTLGVVVYDLDRGFSAGEPFSFGPLFAYSVWENGRCKLGDIHLTTLTSVLGPSAPREGWVFVNGVQMSAFNFGGDHLRLAVTARTAANNTQPVKVSYSVGRDIPMSPCPDC